MDHPDLADPTTSASRRFSLGDGMILIGVLALWLAFCRVPLAMIVDAIRQIPFSSLNTWSDWRGYLFGKNEFAVSFLRFANLCLLNLLMFLIPGMLLMRLRRPRPPWSDLRRQPGFLACALLSLFLAMLFLEMLPLSFLGPPPRRLFMTVPWLVSASVPIAWVVLALRGSWKPEPHWLDRLGRVVGVVWTISSTTHLVLILPYI